VFDNSANVWGGIILVLVVKVVASVFAFPICAILVMQSSPSREVLGTVNGANQALASLFRAVGPAVAGILYSQSLEVGKPWIVWRYGLGVFSFIVWIGAWFLTNEVRLPNPKNYFELSDLDYIAEEVQEEDVSRREENDLQRAISLGKVRASEEGSRIVQEDKYRSRADEVAQGPPYLESIY